MLKWGSVLKKFENWNPEPWNFEGQAGTFNELGMLCKSCQFLRLFFKRPEIQIFVVKCSTFLVVFEIISKLWKAEE